jgi:glycerol 2-dehydrogenase (NADP+)
LYNPDHKLVEYLRSKGIVPEAYSPLGSVGTPLLDDEVAVEVASKHNLKPADVLLAWLRMSNAHFVLTRKQDIYAH